MTTILIILGLLIGPFVVGSMLTRLTRRQLATLETLGCLGITLVFCFTAIGHFIKTEPMVQMLPAWVPGRVPLVYVTGVMEFAAAIAVLIPSLRRTTGWLLITMLILFLPANIYAALNHTGMGGHQWGPIYLLVRIPLQAVLITWVWWFAVRSRQRSDRRTLREADVRRP